MTRNTDIDWSSPVSKEMVRHILNSSFRNDFLADYRFFQADKNKQEYEKWISTNISSVKNELVEDIIVLATKEKIVNKKIEDKCVEVLKGRYFYFTKLACLDYMLILHDRFDVGRFREINNIAISHTKNVIVLFQANLNLCLIDLDSYSYQVANALRKTEYPTLFYRITNQLWLFPEKQAAILAGIVNGLLQEKKFSDPVLLELKHSNRI